MSQLLAMIAILYLCCGLAESNGDQLQRSEIVDRTSPSISDSRNSGTANVRKIRAIKSCKRSSVTPTTILATTASPTVTAASARSASLSTTTTQTLPSSSVISTTTQSVPPSSITSTSTASPSTTSLPVGDPSSFTTFQSEALAQTNSHRTVHCAPNLILNESLNAIAQAYAENIAATRSRVHSGNGYGENLWYKGSSHAINITLINGSSPVDAWYNEVHQYNWTSPGFSASTGHFTQLVWVATTQFGIGIACSSDRKSCYAVANYWSPGNYEGEFESNVKQETSCA